MKVPQKKSSRQWVRKTHVRGETCVVTQTKTIMFKVLSQRRGKKIMSCVKVMS